MNLTKDDRYKNCKYLSRQPTLKNLMDGIVFLLVLAVLGRFLWIRIQVFGSGLWKNVRFGLKDPDPKHCFNLDPTLILHTQPLPLLRTLHNLNLLVSVPIP